MSDRKGAVHAGVRPVGPRRGGRAAAAGGGERRRHGEPSAVEPHDLLGSWSWPSPVSAATPSSSRTRAVLRRGRALPPHVHDAAALVGGDARARARAEPPRDELEPAPARRVRGARPGRVHLRHAARCPQEVPDAKVIVMGQEAKVFKDAGIGPIEDWQPLEAPARRRRWFHDGDGHARRAARLGLRPRRPDPDARRLPDRVEQAARAHALARLAGGRRPDPADCAAALGGAEEDWSRLRDAWGANWGDAHARRRRAAPEPARPDARRQRRRLRAHDAPLVAAGAGARCRSTGSRSGRSTSSPPTPTRSSTCSRAPRASASSEITDWVDASDDPDLKPELDRFRSGEAEGSWENFLYFAAREYFTAQPEDSRHLRAALGRGARGRRHAPLQPHRAARLGAGDPASTGSTTGRSTRGSASPTRSGSPPAPP